MVGENFHFFEILKNYPNRFFSKNHFRICENRAENWSQSRLKFCDFFASQGSKFCHARNSTPPQEKRGFWRRLFWHFFGGVSGQNAAETPYLAVFCIKFFCLRNFQNWKPQKTGGSPQKGCKISVFSVKNFRKKMRKKI